MRSLAGSVRGDGNFSISGTRYPFRVSSGQTQDGSGTRVHLNIDPGERALSVDLEGVLGFESRAPRFDGALVLAAPAPPKLKGSETSPPPWKISAKVKADPAAARLEQVETSYGAEDTALKATGVADIRFGASPLLRASLSARQLDADRLIAKDNSATAPARLLPALRALMASTPGSPIATQVAFSAEQIMLGGRPLQNLEAELTGDARSWTIRRLDFRAPGTTHVVLNGGASPDPSGGFTGALAVDSSDPDTLAAWLQGRSEIAYRSQKPLRLRGNVSVNSDRITVERLKAEIDGGTVEGRIELASQSSSRASRFEAALKADRLDLDAVSAFARSLAGPQARLAR